VLFFVLVDTCLMAGTIAVAALMRPSFVLSRDALPCLLWVARVIIAGSESVFRFLALVLWRFAIVWVVSCFGSFVCRILQVLLLG